MRSWRSLVAIIAVVMWIVAAPLAMASNNCMAMGALCEGPCGATPCVVSQHVDAPTVAQVGAGVTLADDRAVATPLKVPKPPPRLPAFSA